MLVESAGLRNTWVDVLLGDSDPANGIRIAHAWLHSHVHLDLLNRTRNVHLRVVVDDVFLQALQVVKSFHAASSSGDPIRIDGLLADSDLKSLGDNHLHLQNVLNPSQNVPN